jgi:flagellar basal body P-ring protein FlgI
VKRQEGMMPESRLFARILWAAMLLAPALVALDGCTGPVLRSRSQSPEDIAEDVDSQTKFVGDFAVPYGTNYVQVEGPVLITGLAGTGSDPPPSWQRSALLAEMKTHNVVEPNKILASSNTSLGWARALLPPGVRKGDRIDVELRVPGQSETTSIRGGWMMETHLKEMGVIGGQVHSGSELAIAEGPVLVDPVARETADPTASLRGVVLGGGVALKSREMALMLKEEDKSVFLSKQLGDAVNRRFHTYVRGVKQGVANPVSDLRIDLEIHPRYKNNLGRYIQVIRSVAVSESPSQQLQRLELLERQLQDPVTSSQAAIRLEAIGKDGIRVLKKGLEAKDPEVRFYSAESLAYLDESCCVEPLKEASKDQPEFRAYALAALSALNDIRAAEALRELFNVPSAETRYGAFRALWASNQRDPQTRGEHLGEKFWLHEVPSAGAPMVHVTHSFRPEIVLFGEGQQFTTPLAIEAGNSIIVKSLEDGDISVARFSSKQPDQRRTVKNSVADVIRAIAAVGGDYPDAVQALQEARAEGALASRFEVDAIPEWGRTYDRNHRLAHDSAGESGNADTKISPDEDTSVPAVGLQLPNLFGGAPKFVDATDGGEPAAVMADKKPATDSQK